jgi:hypothetical protein
VSLGAIVLWIYKVILLQFIFLVFLCLHFYLEAQAKYFVWDRLVVVLLSIFVSCF